MKNKKVSSRVLGKQLKKFKKLSYTDDLTGLHNHRRLEEDLQHRINTYLRYKISFVLIILDIDGFKQINDIKGHSQADDILKHLALTLKTSLRQTDKIYRYGGDEFVIILPHTYLNRGKRIVKRLQRKIKREMKISITCGVVKLKDETSFDRADKKMLSNKRKK